MAAISRTVQRLGDQQSLWVRQVATKSDIQVLPAAPVIFTGVSFSPDGNYLYLTRSLETSFAHRRLHSMPSLGGTPRMLIDDVDGR